MIYTYAIDPDILSTKNADKLLEIFSHLHQEVLIVDKDSLLEKKYKEKIKQFSQIKIKLERFLMPKLGIGSKSCLRKVIKVDCDYKDNFIEFVENLLINDINLNFIIISKENHDKLLECFGFGSDLLKKVHIINEENYSQKIFYEEIRNVSSQIIDLNNDNEVFINSMIYTNKLEIYLYSFTNTIKTKSIDNNVTFYPPIYNNLKSKHKDNPSFCENESDIAENYKNKYSTIWKLRNLDNVVHYNEFHLTNGDEFLKCLLTTEFFIDCYLEAIKISKMVDKDRKIILFAAEHKDDKLKKNRLRNILTNYFSSRLSANNVKFEIRFLKRTNDKRKAELESHLRHVLTQQKVFDLDTNTIYVLKKEFSLHGTKTYKNLSNAWLRDCEYEFKDSNIRILSDNIKSLRDQNARTQLAKFLENREIFHELVVKESNV